MDSLLHASEPSTTHLGRWGTYLSDRFSVTGDHNAFACFDSSDQLREAVLGFCGAHFHYGYYSYNLWP